MADPHSAPSAGRFEVRATADTHFGWIRTRLSIERTMMSWIRTATALIGFGFAIEQFFERLGQMPGARPAALSRRSAGSRAGTDLLWRPVATHFGLAVPVGHSLPLERNVRPVAGLTREGKHTPVIAVAILLIGIGVFAFLAVLLRVV